MVQALVPAVVAGMAALIGGWLTLWVSRQRMREIGALGAGLLLGGALLGMVPEALHLSDRGPLYVAFGYFGMLLLRSAWSPPTGTDEPVTPLAVAVGLILHSLFDGAALGIAQTGGAALAASTLLAVALHKVPEGFSLAAVVMGAGGSALSAMAAAGAIGLATVVGAWLPLLSVHLGAASQAGLMGLAAGSFLYVGATDLVPALQRRFRGAALLVLAGAAMILLLTRHSLHLH